jgi:hypothetical protein
MMKQRSSQRPARPAAKEKYSFLIAKVRNAYAYELVSNDSIYSPIRALFAAIRAYGSGVLELLRQDYRRAP